MDPMHPCAFGQGTTRANRAYSGDPSRMALWGQSAGAGSVSYYLYAWLEDPIVHAFIADSGTVSSRGAADPTHSNFTALAGMVGCGGLDTAEEFRCMQEVDAKVLEDALSTSNASLAFSPGPDGLTIFSNYTERMAQGRISKIVRIRSTHREASPQDLTDVSAAASYGHQHQ